MFFKFSGKKQNIFWNRNKLQQFKLYIRTVSRKSKIIMCRTEWIMIIYQVVRLQVPIYLLKTENRKTIIIYFVSFFSCHLLSVFSGLSLAKLNTFISSFRLTINTTFFSISQYVLWIRYTFIGKSRKIPNFEFRLNSTAALL